jgi:MTH538 TIR-like domain (DUF1863)
MAKRVFFSFHYQDVIDLRANVVRNHGLTKGNSAGFFDHSLWESVKRAGPTALKRLINDGLHGSSVTCVLIGSETYTRPWVRYELLKSFVRGSSLLGIHINSIKGQDRLTKVLGSNPLASVGVTYSADGQTATLWEWQGGQWARYMEIDGSADYPVDVASQYRGQGYLGGHPNPATDRHLKTGHHP